MRQKCFQNEQKMRDDFWGNPLLAFLGLQVGRPGAEAARKVLTNEPQGFQSRPQAGHYDFIELPIGSSGGLNSNGFCRLTTAWNKKKRNTKKQQTPFTERH